MMRRKKPLDRWIMRGAGIMINGPPSRKWCRREMVMRQARRRQDNDGDYREDIVDDRGIS